MNEISNNKKVLTHPSSPVYLKVGSYDLLGTIGKGNFAVVKLAVHSVTRSKVSISLKSLVKVGPLTSRSLTSWPLIECQLSTALF